ncbi:hypothetical protein B0H13DRAFT_2152908 [Mycena leptocephala]|nr:hypothetical protein B0H13DRAFT_2152908 [Mycena leptocephala]
MPVQLDLYSRGNDDRSHIGESFCLLFEPALCLSSLVRLLFYHQLMDESEACHAFRQRYWLRSYLGYPAIRDSLPNPTHFGLAALQYAHNVDGLHHRALNLSPGIKNDSILELHGSLHYVHYKHGHVVDRTTFQNWLSAANPQWKAFADEAERTGNSRQQAADEP